MLTCDVLTVNDPSSVPALIIPGDYGNGGKKRDISDSSGERVTSAEAVKLHTLLAPLS